MYWKHELKIKSLFTEAVDYETVCKEMKAIADKIDEHFFMNDFPYKEDFRNIPQDIYITYTNSLMFELYEYCDFYRIWIC